MNYIYKPLEEMNYQELNDYSYNNFMQKYYYNEWKKEKPEVGLEIIFSPKCNLKCEYCYVKNFYHSTFPNTLFDNSTAIENTIKYLDWLGRHNYNPNIEIFSGELFAQKAGYLLLDRMLRFYQTHPEYRKPKEIVIPTNGTFLFSKNYTEKIEDYIIQFKKLGTNFILSFSIDGLLLEDKVRNYKKNLDLDEDINLPRTQEFYDKLFIFMKKYNFFIHPMVSAEGIENWKENFLWIQKMYEKYEIDWQDLYLLEVRNYNWSEEKIEKLASFIEFLMDYGWEKTNKSKEEFLEWMVLKNGVAAGFNILSNNIGGSKSYGVKCSQQNFLMLRPADMKVFFCHRIMYPDLEIGEYAFENDEYIFKVKHPELGFVANSYKTTSLPVCNTCNLRYICTTQCMGSCYETTGEIFTPIPSICALNYIKVLTILKKLKEYNCFLDFLDYLTPEKRRALIDFYEKEIN